MEPYRNPAHPHIGATSTWSNDGTGTTSTTGYQEAPRTGVMESAGRPSCGGSRASRARGSTGGARLGFGSGDLQFNGLALRPLGRMVERKIARVSAGCLRLARPRSGSVLAASDHARTPVARDELTERERAPTTGLRVAARVSAVLALRASPSPWSSAGIDVAWPRASWPSVLPLRGSRPGLTADLGGRSGCTPSISRRGLSRTRAPPLAPRKGDLVTGLTNCLTMRVCGAPHHLPSL